MKSNIKTGLLILSIFVWALLPLSASASTLFGVSMNGHSSGNPGTSSLYSIDPSTGAGTFIGDLGYGVEAIAIDPVSGVMYGITTDWSGQFYGLLQIDVTDGSATEIGEFGTSFDTIVGLTSNSIGQLFGWNLARNDYLVKIGSSDGSATAVKQYTLATGVPIMAFDNNDTLILINGNRVYSINPANGWHILRKTLSFIPGSGGVDFEPDTGLLWAPADSSDTQDSWIRVSDTEDGSYYDIDTDVPYLQALAFALDDFGVDSDGDGILDADDYCPETLSDAYVDVDGCSAEQLVDSYCACDFDWKNHGEYVSCVSQAAEEQLEDGLITSEEKDAIVSQRAKMNCGKKK